jgi:hypothetical protein
MVRQLRGVGPATVLITVTQHAEEAIAKVIYDAYDDEGGLR